MYFVSLASINSTKTKIPAIRNKYKECNYKLLQLKYEAYIKIGNTQLLQVV